MIKIIISIILFLIALALGAENRDVVTFNYLIAQGDFHLSTLLAVIFIMGFSLSGILFGGLLLKYQLHAKRLNKKLRAHTNATSLEKIE